MGNHQTLDDLVDLYCVSSNPIKSKIYISVGSIFIFFSLIGVWVPGWPTVSWAVPAAFLFSLSSERMFRWTLTNDYFGEIMFQYYASGKTIPRHAKIVTSMLISLMSSVSSYFVWFVSTKGDGELFDPSSWDGADPGFGALTVLIAGLLGVVYVGFIVPTRES